MHHDLPPGAAPTDLHARPERCLEHALRGQGVRVRRRIAPSNGFHPLPAAAAVVLAGAITLIPYARDHIYQEANVHYNLGNLHYDAGDYDRAIQEYRQALRVNDFEFYRVNLGNALTRKGRYDEAVEQYRRALVKKPRFAKAHIQWAKTLIEQGKIAEARERYRKAVAR